MPIVLRNAHGTIHRTKKVILATIMWRSTLIYQDDIDVSSKMSGGHISHILKSLSLSNIAGITSKLKICQLFTETTDLLEHIIRPRRLIITSRTTDAIRGFKEPTTITKLWSFLRLCDVFWRFFPIFAQPTASLSKKFWRDQPTKFCLLNEK